MSLAEQQAELVRALVAGGPVPNGFDADDLATTSRALLCKRAREVAHRYPTLRYELGHSYVETFCAWAKDRPKTSAAVDGRAFAEHAGIALPGRRRFRWRR